MKYDDPNDVIGITSSLYSVNIYSHDLLALFVGKYHKPTILQYEYGYFVMSQPETKYFNKKNLK